MIDDATRAESRGAERRWGAAAVLLAAVLAGGIVLVGSASTSTAGGAPVATGSGLDGGAGRPVMSQPVTDLDPAGSTS